MSTDPFYITTPLYYVNDKPHLGHAYTTVAADVMTRWHKMHGRETHFLTGTDEHGQKVFDAAQKLNKTPKQHVDAMVEPFKALWEKMDIHFDDFIRTTEDRHTSVVQAVLMVFSSEATYSKTTTKDGILQPPNAFGQRRTLLTASAQILGWLLNGFKRRTTFSKCPNMLTSCASGSKTIRHLFSRNLDEMRCLAICEKMLETSVSLVQNPDCLGVLSCLSMRSM